MPPPELPSDARAAAVETHLARQRRHPVAVAGVVENGLVRPLDSTVKLPEHSRVIIVAAEERRAGTGAAADRQAGACSHAKPHIAVSRKRHT